MSQTKSRQPGWTPSEIEQRLHELTVAELKDHLLPYARVFLAEEKTRLFEQGDQAAELTRVALLTAGGKLTKKADIVTVVSVPFLTPESFQRFRQYLPEEANLILETVVLDGPITSQDIAHRYGIESAESKPDTYRSYRNVYQAKPAFGLYFTPRVYYHSFGEIRDGVTFYWPRFLRHLVRPLLFPEPPALVVEDPPQEAGVQVFQAETLVQEELPGLAIRLQQKLPTLSKRGRPSLPSVRSIGKKLQIQEFFPDTQLKALEALRARCLVGLLAQFSNLSPNLSPEDIKTFFEKGFTQKFHPAIHLLTYLKGIDRISQGHVDKYGIQYEKALAKLPQGQWVQYASFVRSLKASGFSLRSFDGERLQDVAQVIQEKSQATYGLDVKLNVAPNFVDRLFFWPMFHAMTFTFAAWGLLDIAYRVGDQTPLSYAIDSPLNRIVSIRLTALGAYVLERTGSYQSTVKPPFALELAHDSLSILLVEGDQERAAAAIKSFARPLGQQRFFANANFFLNDCKSAEELTQKIDLFKSIFPGELPANWAAFFEELSQQVNPLQAAPGYVVFQLDATNTPLLQLIARDPELKALSLKAEGYLLLVEKRKLKPFKSRLQALGYLLA